MNIVQNRVVKSLIKSLKYLYPIASGSSTMKVAVFSTKSYDKEFLDRFNDGKEHELVYFESALSLKAIRLAEGFDAVCVFVNDQLTNEVVDALSALNIRLIVLRCAGFNNVDIESTVRNHMTVLRVPAYSPNAVAEHAVALILTLNRKTHKAYNRVREGNFSIERLAGFDISGRTTGVIGTGKIGATFAKIMLGFGGKVIAHDINPSKELISMGVEFLPLEDVFRNSDIISLHCPLTPETYQIINKNTLKFMKRGSMLINTSRGKLVDTEAVIDALKEGKLGYVGIDVYEQEEKLFFKDLSEIIITDDKISRLMTFPNVLVTSHQAYFTENALNQIAQTTLRNLTDYEKGTINSQNEVTISMIK